MDFSGYQHPKDIILLAVRYYSSYKLSYRDIEEILAERGSHIDQSHHLGVWMKRLCFLNQGTKSVTHDLIS
ncbi:transposase [Vibrio metoecus]|uniref:transposase n=1 Tax=Vibrio metoecus TaxID=1481663 RepID=UPI0001B99B08|nr:hypothetical protein VCJ_001098 [Vibrio metoecus]